MEHVVFFPAHDGSPAFRRLASLEDAVRFVEHLRNAEGVDHVSVHALTEVPLAFKAYYRVEMPGEGAPFVPEQGSPAVVPVAEGAPVPFAEAAPAESGAHEGEVPVVASEPVAAVVPEQEQPAEPAKASLGFFSRG